MRYGYIGLGNLGGHLAASLLRGGFDVTVNDIDRNLAERHLKAGGKWADTPKALARRRRLRHHLPAVARRVRKSAARRCCEGLKPGATWIEMSTLGRDEILRLAKLAAAKGVRTLECPVTGGVHLAAQGKITVLAGGDTDLFELHRPALRGHGRAALPHGAARLGRLIKVITNMLAFIHLVADGEALMLAKRGGLDLAQAWAAIKASSGTSFVHETEGQLILNGSYDIAFTMDLALKDLGFAMNFGREFGVPLDLATLTNETFAKGKAAYGGSAQSTQIVKLLEDALDTDLRAPGFPARLE